LNSRYNDLYFEYSKYKNIVQLNQIEDKNQQNQMSKTKEQRIFEENTFKNRVDLNYLFSKDIGKRICIYLDYKDILNLRTVNKFINFAFSKDSSYYFLMAKQIRNKWKGIRNDLLKKLSNS